MLGIPLDENSTDATLVLRVIGISPQSPNGKNESLLAHIFFDGSTGEIISSTEQTGYDAEGRST